MKKYLPAVVWIVVVLALVAGAYALGLLNTPIARAQKYIADYQQDRAMRAIGKCVNDKWKGISTAIGGVYVPDMKRLGILVFYDIHDERHGFYTLVAQCSLDSSLDWTELIIVDHLANAYLAIDDGKEHTVLFVYDIVFFTSRDIVVEFIATKSTQEATVLFDGVRAMYITGGQYQNPNYIWKDAWKLLQRKVSLSSH